MITRLNNLKADLQQLRKEVSAVKTPTIGRQTIRNHAELLGSQWFSEFSDILCAEYGIAEEITKKYSQYFERLIKISGPNNKKKSYADTLGAILYSFRDDLVIPLQTRPKGSTTSLMSKIFENLPETVENDYLKEAIDCAQHGFLRAAAVLSWCAAIDRIHHVIQKEGFSKFNIASAMMVSQTKGRFKKFSSVQSVSSMSELREVFDTIILWVIEGMELIESNQHTRLRSCFDLRCQCAHPGEAPVTVFNLMSHFSDLNEIIFKNTKFKLVR